MSTEEGIVIEISDGIALVKTVRSSACESCSQHGSCNSTGSKNEMNVKVNNTLNAQIGDSVIINVKTSSLLKLYLLLYIFPTLCLIIGAVIGKNLASIFIILDESLCSILTGLIFFVISFFLIRARGNKMSGKEEYTPSIIRIKRASNLI